MGSAAIPVSNLRILNLFRVSGFGFTQLRVERPVHCHDNLHCKDREPEQLESKAEYWAAEKGGEAAGQNLPCTFKSSV